MKKMMAAVTFVAISLFAFNQNLEPQLSLDQKSQSLFTNKYLNDTTWVIDSAVTQRITDSGFINREKRTTISVDNNGRVVSEVWQYWDIDQYAWINNRLDSINFYSLSDILSKQISYSWDSQESIWKIVTYKSYSESGLPLLQYSKNWDEISGKYTSGFRLRWEYSQDGLLSVYHWDDFNTDLQDFEDRTKRTYYYNEIGQDTSYIIEKWNTSSQIWSNLERSDIEYHESGGVAVATNYNWNGETSSWNRNTRVAYSVVDQIDQDTTTYFDWLTDLEIWFPSYRSIRRYENGKLVELTKQDCLFPADNFGNSTRLLYVFDNDLLMEERGQLWAGDHWRDDHVDLFTYVFDTLLESQTMITYNINDQSYDSGLRMITEYDDRPLAIETLTQHWDSDESEFVTFLRTTYYWSAFGTTAVINEPDDLMFTIFPNPTTGMVQVRLDETPVSGSKLIVHDLSGRLVLEKFIHNDHFTVDLSKQAKGSYFIQVISGMTRGMRQVIKH